MPETLKMGNYRNSSGHHELNERKCKLSVVVPCFNEEECIGLLYQRVTDICSKVVGEEYELILINDGSSDETWPLIIDLSSKDPKVIGISLSRNFGHQIALSAGLSSSFGERVFVIDADLQDPPELLPEMMQLMDNGAEIVYGKRAIRHGEGWFKKTTASLFYRLLNKLADISIPNDTGDFRLMSRKVVDILNQMPERHRFIRGLVSWIGFEQVPIIYDRQGRYSGTTKYPLRKMFIFAMDAITSFSIRPLRVATLLATLIATFALISLVYVFYGWMLSKTVPGWPSVMTVVLILGSIQLFVIGVIGEYIGRQFLESKHRPLFIIDQVSQRTETAHDSFEKDG
jgi:glycosyltransferase involved in cell wall biosynthesis